MCKTATSGQVRWNISFERVQADTLDVDADDFDGAHHIVGEVNATTGQTDVVSLRFTNAQADSIAAGDKYRLKISRDTSVPDNVVGDAQLVSVSLKEAA